jgi:hypothetical protein
MQTQEENSNDNPYQSPKAQLSASIDETASYQGKVYSLLAIAIGTIFGSVLAAGLLVHSNFSHFKLNLQANITVALTIVATIGFLFASLFVEHPSSILYMGFNFVVAICLFPVVYFLQGDLLEQHEDKNLPFHSTFRAAAVGIACLLAMGMMLTFAYTMFIIASR